MVCLKRTSRASILRRLWPEKRSFRKPMNSARNAKRLRTMSSAPRLATSLCKEAEPEKIALYEEKWGQCHGVLRDIYGTSSEERQKKFVTTLRCSASSRVNPNDGEVERTRKADSNSKATPAPHSARSTRTRARRAAARCADRRTAGVRENYYTGLRSSEPWCAERGVVRRLLRGGTLMTSDLDGRVCWPAQAGVGSGAVAPKGP